MTNSRAKINNNKSIFHETAHLSNKKKSSQLKSINRTLKCHISNHLLI
jgi:hypothetical protein